MKTSDIISLACLIIGAIDFIVVPRILIFFWNRSNKDVSQGKMVIQILRLSGLAFVVVGALIRFGYIRV